MVELLSPVQDFVSLKAAIDAKADAVYFGIKKLNMRAKAKNFKLKDLKKIVSICHDKKVKAYLALNTIIYDNEIPELRKILKKAKEAKIDAIICWDFSVVSEVQKLNLPIHISTQASISNFEALKNLKKNFSKIERVILARELSLEQIKNIIKKIKQENLGVGIEVFVHGAMCVSISGRCFMSHYLFGKSANRGECLQPCRRKYIVKDIEEEHELELGDDYVMSTKDLCTIEFIDKLIKAGIAAFKIEGRNRSPEYVKTVTECYREAIDNYKSLKNIKQKLLKKLKTVYNRGFSDGFYLGKPLNAWTDKYGSKATKKKVYIGIVKNFYKQHSVAEIKIESGSIKVGNEIMFQGNKTGVFSQKVASMEINGKKIEHTDSRRNVGIKTENIVRENDKVFLIIANDFNKRNFLNAKSHLLIRKRHC